MRLLFNEAGDKLFYAVPDKDLFWFMHTTNIPLVGLNIDEIDPINKAICLDLMQTVNKSDEAGRGKYYLSGGELMLRVGWTEKVRYIA